MHAARRRSHAISPELVSATIATHALMPLFGQQCLSVAIQLVPGRRNLKLQATSGLLARRKVRACLSKWSRPWIVICRGISNRALLLQLEQGLPERAGQAADQRNFDLT